MCAINAYVISMVVMTFAIAFALIAYIFVSKYRRTSIYKQLSKTLKFTDFLGFKKKKKSYSRMILFKSTSTMNFYLVL